MTWWTNSGASGWSIVAVSWVVLPSALMTAGPLRLPQTLAER